MELERERNREERGRGSDKRALRAEIYYYSLYQIHCFDVVRNMQTIPLLLLSWLKEM